MSEPEKPNDRSVSIEGRTRSSGHVRATAHEHLPDDHPAYALIGRVAAQWAQVEHALDEIIWELAGLDQHTGSCISGQLLGYRGRIEAVHALAMRHGMSTETMKRINKLRNELQDPYDRRNRFVHDAWYIQHPDELGQFRSLTRQTRTFGFEPVDDEQGKRTIEIIQQAVTMVRDLHAHFSEMLRSLRDKQR